MTLGPRKRREQRNIRRSQRDLTQRGRSNSDYIVGHDQQWHQTSIDRLELVDEDDFNFIMILAYLLLSQFIFIGFIWCSILVNMGFSWYNNWMTNTIWWIPQILHIYFYLSTIFCVCLNMFLLTPIRKTKLWCRPLY